MRHAHHPHRSRLPPIFFGCGGREGARHHPRGHQGCRLRQFAASDTLLHLDQVDQETLDGYLSARGHWRRKFLQASSFMGALAAVEAMVREAGAGRKSPARRRSANPIVEAACT